MILFQFDRIVPAVVIGFFLDLLLGDPRWLYHPVRLIGRLIETLEKAFRKLNREDKKGEQTAGIQTAVCVIFISMLVPWLILQLLYWLNFWAGFAVETFWCYQLIATRALRDESMKVYAQAKKKDLPAARRAVSMIVGRDVDKLDLAGVIRAAVETVAENASDGVIAPLLCMLVGGAVGGFFYKSINTMDSMIGYKNSRYRYFGTFAARMDDVVNFLPARISGLLFVPAARLMHEDAANAWKIFKRDRKKHDSPNSAHTEAAMAGALDIQLAGDAWYFGELHHKQTLGDPIRPVGAEDIPRANCLVLAAAVLALILGAAVRLLLLLILRTAL